MGYQQEELNELEAFDRELRRIRDTLVSLIGAGLMAFALMGIYLEIPIVNPRVSVIVYGVLMAGGGLIAVIGVLMGVVGMLRRAPPEEG